MNLPRIGLEFISEFLNRQPLFAARAQDIQDAPLTKHRLPVNLAVRTCRIRISAARHEKSLHGWATLYTQLQENWKCRLSAVGHRMSCLTGIILDESQFTQNRAAVALTKWRVGKLEDLAEKVSHQKGYVLEDCLNPAGKQATAAGEYTNMHTSPESSGGVKFGLAAAGILQSSGNRY
ncbi:MAG: hypothetical protein JWM11_2120 [Planctomycetaceae bacterium]|nr:hypothetical protein [Planctomycetaceae bacterium]